MQHCVASMYMTAENECNLNILPLRLRLNSANSWRNLDWIERYGTLPTLRIDFLQQPRYPTWLFPIHVHVLHLLI